MLGIDLVDGRGVVATYRSPGASVLGEGGSFTELVELAVSRLGDACRQQPVAIAVPAWFHDGQRGEVVAAARAAGLEWLQLVNRPTAVALAYATLRPEPEPGPALVVELLGGRADLTVVAPAEESFEVRAADGVSEPADSTRWLDELERGAARVVKAAGLGVEGLGPVLVAGERREAERLGGRLGAYGPLCLELDPREVVAVGAAIRAASLAAAGPPPVLGAKRLERPERAEQGGRPNVRSEGCGAVVAALVIGALAWIALGR